MKNKHVDLNILDATGEFYINDDVMFGTLADDFYANGNLTFDGEPNCVMHLPADFLQVLDGQLNDYTPVGAPDGFSPSSDHAVHLRGNFQIDNNVADSDHIEYPDLEMITKLDASQLKTNVVSENMRKLFEPMIGNNELTTTELANKSDFSGLDDKNMQQ